MPVPMKKRVLLIAAVAAVAAAVWLWPLKTHRDTQPLTLYGNVDSRLVDVAFRVEGRLAEMRVEEGEAVRQGQVVARIDADYLRDQVALARARVAAQQAAVDKLTAGSRTAEIAQARALVAERKAAVANAQTTFARQLDLARHDVASKQKRDDAEAALKKAEAQLEQAGKALELSVAGPREEDIRAALAVLDGEQAALALAERRLADAELTAPASGTIQTRVREPGAILAAGATVYTIALTSPVWVRAYVAEPDLGRVVPGAKVSILTDSRPEQPYEGRVGFVSAVAEFTPKTVETPELRTSLVYRFRVVVENPDQGLRQGMPVTLTLGGGA